MNKILSLLLILSSFCNLIIGSHASKIGYLSDKCQDRPIKIWDLDENNKIKLGGLDTGAGTIDITSIDPEGKLYNKYEEAKKDKAEKKVIETASPNSKYVAIANILSKKFTIKDTDPTVKFQITEEVDFPISDILWSTDSLMIAGFDIKDEKALMQRFKRYTSEDLEKLGINDALNL